MKLVAFDLEIAKELPDNTSDWDEFRPLGVTCAQALGDDVNHVWSGTPQLTKEQCVSIVDTLEHLVDDGYTIVTHNGLSFDFRTLAEESGERDRCARLAFLHHVDTMFLVTRVRGHFIGLDGVARGMGVPEKRHTVTLSDGSTIDNMNGAMAPRMWAQGETDAVLHYLEGDCQTTLAVAKAIQEQGAIKYLFKSGKGGGEIAVDGLPTVMDVLQMPRDKASWLRYAHPYTRMLSWTGCSLYFIEFGQQYRLPGKDEDEARFYLAAHTGFDVDDRIEELIDTHVTLRWKNETALPVTEDEVTF